MEKNCKKWWWQEKGKGWTQTTEGIFEIESQGKTNNVTSPHSYGIIVISEPSSETYFDPGTGWVAVASGGKKRIFNHIFDVGVHRLCVLGRTDPDDQEKKWREQVIEITVSPRKIDENDPIANFYQSKVSGQYANGSTGLDVAFSISLRENPQKIEWMYSKKFEKQYPKENASWPKAASLLSVNKTYKHVGTHEGYVKVWNNKGKEFTREFIVIITDLGSG